tara:strand:+ start:40745 stop:41053 length:309 start_codon:yes stop_codon:yes gene_type:complete
MLTGAQKRSIIARRKNGEKVSYIAKIFSVTYGEIMKVLNEPPAERQKKYDVKYRKMRAVKQDLRDGGDPKVVADIHGLTPRELAKVLGKLEAENANTITEDG